MGSTRPSISMLGEDSNSEYNAVQSESRDQRSDITIDDESSKYWFGKKYFECILAQQIWAVHSVDSSSSFLDSQWEKSLRSFPYHEALLELRSKLHPQLSDSSLTNDEYQALMTLIATVVRQGKSSDRETVLATVREHSKIEDEQQDQADSPSQESLSTTRTRSRSDSMGSQSSNELEEPEEPEQSEESEKPEISPGQYTLLLKELADKEGGEIKYSDPVRSASNFDIFHTTLKFRGKTFEGTGRNRRMAKHQASEMAYRDIKRNQ